MAYAYVLDSGLLLILLMTSKLYSGVFYEDILQVHEVIPIQTEKIKFKGYFSQT